jgi:hypothetical protein
LSTDAAVGWFARAGFGDERSIRVLRLGVGITLSAAVSLGIGWPLSFMTPVLATSLLASRTPCPTLAAGAMLVCVITIAGAVGLVVVAPLALYYPLVCAVALGLLLFGIFRAGYGGASPFLILFLLVAVLLIPMIAQQSLTAAQEVTAGLIAGGAAAVGLTWVAYALFPDLPGTAVATAIAEGWAPDPHDLEQRAAVTTAVVYPVALLFYGFGLTGDLVVLVFIAILAQQPSLTAGRKAGGALILGNLAGGVAAMVFYELLVVAPSFGFFLTLTFLTVLVLGTKIFSDHRFAPIYPTVLSTLLLLVGGSVAPLGDDVEAKFQLRILQIGIAVVYVVGSLALIERLRAESARAKPS